MKILDRYLVGSFFRAWLVIILILLLLFSFIELLGQLDDIGTGNYHLLNAVIYVVYTLPGRLFDLLPVATMLGSITGLWILADHQELLAMQALGRSNLQTCRPILAAGLLLMLLAAGMAEYVVPPLEQQARTQRLLALSNTGMLVTDNDLWLRNRDKLIRIGKSSLYGITSDLDIYQRDGEGRLLAYFHSPHARIKNRRQWLLKNVEKKKFTPEGGIVTTHLPELTLDLSLSARQLTILRFPPETLSPSRLYRYIRELRRRGQNPEHYTMILWQKLCQPFTMGAMIILSLSLIFGPTRNISAGLRIMIATLAGIGVYLFNQIIGNLGLLFDLHPALTTITPVIVILALSYGLHRQRSRQS